MLVEIFSGEFLNSEKVVRFRKRSLITIKLQLSPIISSAVLTGQPERLFLILIKIFIYLTKEIKIGLKRKLL
jgi:hypothetical protein